MRDLHMILINEYDLLNNSRIFISLNIFSVFLFFFFIFLFSMVGISVLGLDEFDFSINFEDLLYFLPFFLAGFFLVICIHELIHGSFSKLFNKEAHIRYGFKKGCPYVTAPGARYSRAQFTWICLAPFVLISPLLTLLVLKKIEKLNLASRTDLLMQLVHILFIQKESSSGFVLLLSHSSHLYSYLRYL